MYVYIWFLLDGTLQFDSLYTFMGKFYSIPVIYRETK